MNYYIPSLTAMEAVYWVNGPANAAFSLDRRFPTVRNIFGHLWALSLIMLLSQCPIRTELYLYNDSCVEPAYSDCHCLKEACS
jgi:hypothetical protein